MRRVVLGCLIVTMVAVAAGGFAAARTSRHAKAAAKSPYGAWSITDKTSLFDQTPDFVAAISADNTVFGDKSQPGRPVLLVKCDHTGFLLNILWPAHISSSHRPPTDAAVNWRLDNGPPQKSYWYANSKAFVGKHETDPYVGKDDTDLAIIRRWSAGKVLAVRVTDKFGSEDVSFHLNGLDKIIDHMDALKCMQPTPLPAASSAAPTPPK